MEKELKDYLDKIDNKITGLDNSITGLENSITGLDNKIIGLENNITGLDNKITGLKKYIVDSVGMLDNGIMALAGADTIEANSPVALNDKGKAIAKEAGLYELAEKYYPHVSEELGLNIKDRMQLEEGIFKIMIKYRNIFDSEEIIKIQNVVHAHGGGAMSLSKTLTVIIRDIYLKNHPEI